MSILRGQARCGNSPDPRWPDRGGRRKRGRLPHAWPALVVAVCCAAYAQGPAQYTILPFAGMQRNIGDNGPAVSALLNDPHGIATDRNGALYIADTGYNAIRRVSPSGTIATLSSQTSFPWHAVPGPSGEVYVADAANNRILRIAPDGTQANFAGGIKLNSPRDVAVDGSGAVFILDTGNNRVVKVAPDGSVSVYAGNGNPGFLGDGGPATQAMLNFPYGIALDSAGNLFISDSLNQRIRVVTRDGVINTIAGINARGFNNDGAAFNVAFNYPAGLAVDAAGSLYVADSANHRVRKITQPLSAAAQVTTIAGNGIPGYTGDLGSARASELNSPFGVAVDAQGNVLIADSGNHRIRKIDSQGNITTIAGSDHGSGDNGPALSARMFAPAGIVFDPSGNAYIADTNTNTVRRVSTDGTISLVASGLNAPNGIALDSTGALYIADTNAHVIRKVAGGAISVVAGIPGEYGNDGDGGPATSAHLETPNAVAFDKAGNMYIADSGNNRIRVVAPGGTIYQFAGDSQWGLPGYDGDNGPATAAHLRYPRALAVDNGGNVYIADFFNDCVRMVSASTHSIYTIAGTGVRGGAGEGGSATGAQLALPTGLAFDKQGNLLIADSLNNRICVIVNGVLHTIAGGNGAGDNGDGGPALQAQLASPRDVAVDPKGNIYFSDQDNGRVRRLVTGSVQIAAVVNAASQSGGAVAPGEMVSIYGVQLAPSGVASYVPPVTAALSTAAASTQVFFDGVAAPLMWISAGQINAIVPYEIAGRGSTNMVVVSQSMRSDPVSLRVVDTAPGIFANSTGAVLNQDGSQNAPSNPARAGDIVVLFATGEGQTSPAGVTGKLVTTPLPRPLLPVTVQVGGKTAQLYYSGEMPDGAGVLQVNFVVPDGVAAGDRVPVVLTVGSQQAQSGITMSVR